MLKIKCPKCGGDTCLQSFGKTTGTTIGILVGILSTAIVHMTGTKNVAPKCVKVIVNKVMLSLAGYTWDLLANVSTGGFIGQQAGNLIDENLIRNYHCLKCKNKFRI